jgi:multiple inositol-polyphosphate phosphatase/2,3-bisphosphoglycerate 3-phosphatase
MKKILFAGLIIALSNSVVAQCEFNAGTKTLYKPNIAIDKIPEGYSTVFINHAGRHGSRHLTKDLTATGSYQLLKKAEAAGMLTDKGVRLFQFLNGLHREEQKKLKSISEKGKEEQQGIADRMYAQYPGIFTKNAVFKVQITKEVRTKQTADAFLGELKKKSGNTSNIAYKVNDTALRFYDLSPAYLRFEDSGTWVGNLQSIKAKKMKHGFSENIASRFFKSDFLVSMDAEKASSFVNDMYGFLTIIPSVNEELLAENIALTQDSLQQFFSCKELRILGEVDRAEDYFLKGPGSDNDGIQVRIAAPLLVDFVNTTDEFIHTGNTAAQFRFSHAETIAPFASFLELEAATKAVNKAVRFNDKVWDASKIVPLSANVQWIFYKNAAGNYLIKIMLNEKDARIKGLRTKTFPYYQWNDVRAFYMQKLNRLHVSLSGNQYSYLQHVQ